MSGLLFAPSERFREYVPDETDTLALSGSPTVLLRIWQVDCVGWMW